ncbi:MAG: hypothetical protein ACTSRZ_05800 [Promethearchaeota archaeon]
MGLGKGFGIGLVIYIILNFVMNLLLVWAGGMDIGTWFGAISSDIYLWLTNLFFVNLGAGLTDLAVQFSSGVLAGINGIMTGGASLLPGIFTLLAAILPGLLTAIIAGKLAEGAGKGFAAWMLIVIIDLAIIAVLYILEIQIGNGAAAFVTVMAYIHSISAGNAWMTVVVFVLVGIISTFFWGGIGALAGKQE